MPEFEPVLTARWADPAAATMDGYLASGGYRGLAKALEDAGPELNISLDGNLAGTPDA